MTITIVNIKGSNNEVNAILKSNTAYVIDEEDIINNLNTGTSTIDFSTNFIYDLDISGNYNEANIVYDSSDSVLMDGNDVMNNNNLTGFTII